MDIQVLSFSQLSDGSFEASGTCDGVSFLARTIVYRGEPIFKVQETGEDGEVSHQRMADSQFTRGARIAIARQLKKVRLDGGLPAEQLSELTVKELRARCAALGLKGHSARGVRKADLVARLSAAA
tara:strand:- start:1284 stop:1661 length:378 start_codon:yes stop_codon:yes gene_type:complete